MQRRRSRLGQTGERQLDNAHAVAQVVPLLERLDGLMLGGGNVERPSMQGIGQDGELAPFLRAALMPLAGDVVACHDTAQPLGDPLCAITL